jgi:hypothetical protein
MGKELTAVAGPDVERMRRDQNLDGGQLKLSNKVYAKGLAVHARTEITVELDGAYREFRVVLGIDDSVGGRDDGTVVTVFGDGKELLKTTITRKDGPQEKAVNIKDVKELKILVASPDILDLGKHVDLADAKVTK